ncbi:hypothetical protein SAMN05421593_0706 [Chryseobacterium culicis]|uniref:Uncharacterized protein n=1 Tax=Chryseobacterium culicis TaxID=680127 RepID=A0A1H6GY64_CHRCI|nr:hypothetical protein SAMN05421593_0706 [Chryseobacterium culicis]
MYFRKAKFVRGNDPLVIVNNEHDKTKIRKRKKTSG